MPLAAPIIKRFTRLHEIAEGKTHPYRITRRWLLDTPIGRALEGCEKKRCLFLRRKVAELSLFHQGSAAVID